MKKKELRNAAKRRRKVVNHPSPRGLRRKAQLLKKRRKTRAGKKRR